MTEQLILLIDRWRQYKGKGNIIVSNTDDGYKAKEIITKEVITRFLGNNPNGNILLVSNTGLGISSNSSITNINVSNFIMNTRVVHTTDLFICDTSNINSDKLLLLLRLVNARFILYFTDVDEDVRFILTTPILNRIEPEITTEVVNVELTSRYKELYDDYTSFISEAMSKFNITDEDLNNLDGISNIFTLINACAMGFKSKNGFVEPSYYRNYLATLMGWTNDLDITIPYLKEIHNSFNPARIGELANNVTSIMSKRTALLKESKDKINKIVEVVKQNLGYNIVIINPNSHVADELQEKLEADNIQVGIYHNNISGYKLKDDNGDYITYKSKAKAGVVKLHGAISVKKNTLDRYNNMKLNIINVGSRINDKFIINRCDVVIINNIYVKLDTILKNKNFKLSNNRRIKLIFIGHLSTTDNYKIDSLLYKYKLKYNKARGITKNI